MVFENGSLELKESIYHVSYLCSLYQLGAQHINLEKNVSVAL